jgi:hypothetical protein
MIVNGPIAAALDINAGDNLFGPGWRANLAIGRAVRLIMRNVCGSRPGELDRGTLGHPGKLSYVIAENEAESPWVPLHVERGYRPEQSAVTVVAAEAPHQFYNQLSRTAEGVLTTLADDMRVSGNVMGQPTYCVVLAGEHMRTIAGDGWTKKEIRAFLHEHTRTPTRISSARGGWRGRSARRRDDPAAPRRRTGAHPGRGRRRTGRGVLLLHSRLGQCPQLRGRHQGGQAMIELLDPTTEAAAQAVAYAARPDTLAGKRVALVENTFNRTSSAEDRRTSSRSTASPRPSSTTSATPASPPVRRSSRTSRSPATWWSPASATEAPARRAVCSTESAEKARSSASIVTDVFEATGRAMAVQWGLPHYKFLMMPHPIANLSEAHLDERAREILPEVVKLLLQGQE